MSATPIRPNCQKAYLRALRFLKRREPMMIEEGGRLYLAYGGQRATGFVDGYRWAKESLTGATPKRTE